MCANKRCSFRALIQRSWLKPRSLGKKKRSNSSDGPEPLMYFAICCCCFVRTHSSDRSSLKHSRAEFRRLATRGPSILINTPFRGFTALTSCPAGSAIISKIHHWHHVTGGGGSKWGSGSQLCHSAAAMCSYLLHQEALEVEPSELVTDQF